MFLLTRPQLKSGFKENSKIPTHYNFGIHVFIQYVNMI